MGITVHGRLELSPRTFDSADDERVTCRTVLTSDRAPEQVTVTYTIAEGSGVYLVGAGETRVDEVVRTATVRSTNTTLRHRLQLEVEPDHGSIVKIRARYRAENSRSRSRRLNVT